LSVHHCERQALIRQLILNPMTSSLPTTAPPTLVALSGPSSCGKTTLARLLARIFPSTSVLHADDYYLPDSEIPIHHGVQDWDCAEAINISKLENALQRVKHGEGVEEVRDGVASMEIPEGEGEEVQWKEVVGRLREDMERWAEAMRAEKGKGWRPRRLVVVDGFLLLGPSVRSIRALFDVKVLLRSRYEDSKRRREARSGYTTLEGWWEDPPGYFDEIVWPNFVKEHAFLFEGGDLQASVREDAAGKEGIEVVPGMGQRSLEETLDWAVGIVRKGLENER